MKIVQLGLLLLVGLPGMAASPAGREVWRDDFASGLGRWQVSDTSAIYTADSGDPQHGRVLVMNPAQARLHALITGSATWSMYRVEGDVLFPTNENNYLGFIYNYAERDGRVDLGSIYIKGNGSYVRVNPRRDWNPGRRLYEELRVELGGTDAIVIGQWQRFAAEVHGHVCHFYVGDMNTPKVTFGLFEADAGMVGFKPRVVGGPVWIDNIRVLSIQNLSYQGPDLPQVVYNPARLVTNWEALGPIERAVTEIERQASPLAVVESGEHQYRWRPFACDARGAVITAQLTDFVGGRTVAYFRTTINLPKSVDAALEFSTIDDMAIWVNGKFEGYSYGEQYAWHDFIENPNHPATPHAGVALGEGPNHVLIRIRGGRYATGGFFAAVVTREATE